MANCSNCTGIDVFPLRKCETVKGGGTGPTGPQGKRGVGGGSSNYLAVALTNGVSLSPLQIISVPFDTESVNKGWSFTPGQTKFVVPETGTYVINFFTSSVVQFINDNPKTPVYITITQTTKVTGNADVPIKSNKTFDLAPPQTFIFTPLSNPEIIAPLTAGAEIEFIFTIDRETTGDSETISLAFAVLTLQRIA